MSSQPTQGLLVEAERDSFLEPFVGGLAFRLKQSGSGGCVLADALSEMERSGARFAHIRVAAREATVSALATAGFDRVETLVTYALSLSNARREPEMPPGTRLRQARPGDLSHCRRIAEEAFVHNRFNRDPHMDPEAARALKGEWMANNFSGRADRILVADVEGQVCGFVTCLLQGSNAVIDLVAVVPERQNVGLGRALLQAAADEYIGRAARLCAGTQASNGPSMRMYEASGFAPAASQDTFHRWWPA